MTRSWFVNGETMVAVKSNVNSAIPVLTQLGLAADAIRVTPQTFYKDIRVDAWGDAPPEVQMMLGTLTVEMTLVHVDTGVLRECIRLSQGMAAAEGEFNRAGTLLGNGQPRFAANNFYIGLNLSSIVGGLPWRFFFSYLPDRPYEWPLGTEKSLIRCTFRVIPYTVDPWNNGAGALNYPLYDRNQDT